MKSGFTSLPALVALWLALVSSSLLADVHFPRPVELQPDVDFWVRVYTEVDTRSGYVHDAEDIDVFFA